MTSLTQFVKGPKLTLESWTKVMRFSIFFFFRSFYFARLQMQYFILIVNIRTMASVRGNFNEDGNNRERSEHK